jgi:hypothetical protein
VIEVDQRSQRRLRELLQPVADGPRRRNPGQPAEARDEWAAREVPKMRAIVRMVSESPGRNASARWPRKIRPWRPSGRSLREGNIGCRSLADAAERSGGV